MSARRARFAALALTAVFAPRAGAWPAELSQRIAKDALKLLPQSLAELFIENQDEIFAEGRGTKMKALPLLYEDIPKGKLSASTREALGSELAERLKGFAGDDFRGAVIALGATYRLSADLADPGVGARIGTDARGRSIRREFYAFVLANVDKIPVVVVRPESMRLAPEAVPAFMNEVVGRTADQSAMLREEAVENGRVVPAKEIDFRSPVFAVASTSYSRSVNAVAATWIAVWRAAGGDMRRQKPPRLIKPRD